MFCYYLLAFIVVFVFIRFYLTKPVISVTDKVVVITGASSGIGKECARLLYKSGCKLVLCAPEIDQLKSVKDEFLSNGKAGLHEPVIHSFDLSDKSENITLDAEKIVSYFGKVDILINNGGISFRGAVLNTKISVDERLMKIDYLGHVALTKGLLPTMVANGYGHIVGVSSIQGKFAIPHRSAYAAAKHAFQAFFDSLRSEVESLNIHVSVISPAYVRTNLSINAVTHSGAQYGKLDATTASGVTPDYIAEQILYCVTHNIPEIVIAPWYYKMVILIRHMVPSLYFKIMAYRAAKNSAQYDANKTK